MSCVETCEENMSGAALVSCVETCKAHVGSQLMSCVESQAIHNMLEIDRNKRVLSKYTTSDRTILCENLI